MVIIKCYFSREHIALSLTKNGVNMKLGKMNRLKALCMMHFLRKSHSTEQIRFMRVFPPGTHLQTESTEAMRIKCLAQGHNVLMQLRFEPSIAVSANRHLAYITNMLVCDSSHPNVTDVTLDRPKIVQCIHRETNAMKVVLSLINECGLIHLHHLTVPLNL